MANVTECLNEALQIDGSLAVALGDWKSGMCLGANGANTAAYPASKLELAIAGNTEVIRAKKTAAQSLGLNDHIEDILITLKTQYHLIRMVEAHPSLFFYLVLDRNKSNLAMARLKLTQIEQKISI